MRDRFSFTGTKQTRFPKTALFVLVWAGIILLFIYGTNRLAAYSTDKQFESLETAVSADIAQCYAIEGFYPPDIDYLKERYGLYYDEERFFVDYRSIGSNLYPDVTIIDRKKQTGQ